MKKKVFVCSPFAGNIEANTRMAIQYCQLEIAMGNLPYAPHLFFPRLLDESTPEHRELGISLGLEMLAVCDELHVYGSLISRGMRREIAAWRSMGRRETMCDVTFIVKKQEAI